MSNKITYTIGELAKQFDITTRSIRFYEDEGLLSPRRQGQHRIYNNKDVARYIVTKFNDRTVNFFDKLYAEAISDIQKYDKDTDKSKNTDK